MGSEAARTALLAESFRAWPGLASGSPARSEKHPFTKVIGGSTKDIIARWQQNGLMRSCPDLAIRKPAPHTIVFEAKCFRSGSLERAQADLVTGIYQAFFYRGLPAIPETPKRPAWGYEYACLLVVDCSPEGNAVNAWRSLRASVRKACWEGANIYVMMLRGGESSALPQLEPGRSQGEETPDGHVSTSERE